jgi:hypothetical protein
MVLRRSAHRSSLSCSTPPSKASSISFIADRGRLAAEIYWILSQFQVLA